MKNRITKMFFHQNKHRLSVWSSLGLFFLGMSLFLLCLFNIPLFLQLVGYAVTVYYLLDIEAGYEEEKVISKAQNRLTKNDLVYFNFVQIVIVILGMIELLALLYCQFTNYYHFILLVATFTGIYFTHWSYNYGLGIYQIKKNIKLGSRSTLIGEGIIMVIADLLMAITFLLSDWFFFASVLGLALLEWAISWRNYYVFKNADRNHMGY